MACANEPNPKFMLTDITGANFAKDFKLIDHTGKSRSLADFKGKVVAIFFGYTHCPDMCPTTLAELAQVVSALGNDSVKVQVLFVTVDPQRDTPQFLSKYVTAFHPSFLGLHADSAMLAQTAKEFKITYQQTTDGSGPYMMDHSTGTYIYDKNGRLRLYAAYGQGPTALLHDIRILLKE